MGYVYIFICFSMILAALFDAIWHMHCFMGKEEQISPHSVFMGLTRK